MKQIMQNFFGRWEPDFNHLVPLFRLSLFRVVLFFLYFILRKQPQEMFCKKRCFKNFANFTGKHLCWSLFLLKRDSNSGVFQWNLWSFLEHLFWRTSADDCFWIYWGYYALPWNNFKETNGKANFQVGKEFIRKQHFEW